MPRKLKVIDVEAPVDTVIPDVNASADAIVDHETVEVNEPIEPVTTPPLAKKPRAKRVPKKETIIDTSLLDKGIKMDDDVTPPEPIVLSEPVVPTEPVLPVSEPDITKKNIKTVELVSCPNCNKQLTSRTLKYTHQNVCPANENKIKKEKVKPVKQQEQEQDEDPPHIQKVKRLHSRSERYKNLITNAF